MCDDTAEDESRRSLPRYLVASLIPVHYEESPKKKGWIFDINERGMRTCGLNATPGEVKRLVLSIRGTEKIEEIYVEAQCRWFSQEGSAGPSMAGFMISHISEEDLRALRGLIRRMTGCQYR
jgi:hypothetical protein